MGGKFRQLKLVHFVNGVWRQEGCQERRSPEKKAKGGSGATGGAVPGSSDSWKKRGKGVFRMHQKPDL